MRNAHPTRRELELRFDGLDEVPDLTELLAGHHDLTAVLVRIGPECEELGEVADLLAELEAELAARESAELQAAAVGEWPLAGVVGLGRKQAARPAVVVVDVETEDEVA